MNDFISYGESVRTFGLRRTWRMMRQALGITRQLAPWSGKGNKRGKREKGRPVMGTRDE